MKCYTWTIMKTIILFFTTLIFFSVKAYSQEQLKFDTTARIVSEKYQYIKLLDQRNSSVVGTIKNRYIETEGQFINDLQEYVNSICLTGEGKDTLLCVLYDCIAEDKPYYDDIVIYHFDALFFAGRENQYRYVGAVDTFLEQRFTLHFSRKALQKFNNLIVGVFQEAATYSFTSTTEILTADEVEHYRQNIQGQYAVYNHPVKKGLYYTMEDFLNQTPLDTLIVIKRTDYNEVQFFYANEKGKATKKVEKFFACKIKNSVYCNYRNTGSKMKFSNNDIYVNLILKGIMYRMPAANFSNAVTNAVLSSSKQDGIYMCRFDPIRKKFLRVRRVK